MIFFFLLTFNFCFYKISIQKLNLIFYFHQKVFIQGDRGDYFSLIYDETNEDGLCNYYEMITCEHQNHQKLMNSK